MSGGLYDVISVSPILPLCFFIAVLDREGVSCPFALRHSFFVPETTLLSRSISTTPSPSTAGIKGLLSFISIERTNHTTELKTAAREPGPMEQCTPFPQRFSKNIDSVLI